jgi:predicted Zn-dependent protease with MMP-like domain
MVGMIEVTEEQFKQFVSEAIDAIPEPYASSMNNVAFVVEDEPTPQQRIKMKLDPHQTLFGLYEGIPLTKRGAGYNMVLPDKITIFKRPMEMMSRSAEEVKKQVHKTVWHEVAHHFGLEHLHIDRLENKN